MKAFVHEIHFDPGQQDQYIPVWFDMPPATERVDVRCDYDQARNCVIDIGCLEGERFRGWSGGARLEFYLTVEKATPGYEPGALTPGRWAVLLGTYRIPPEGCTVRIRVSFTPRRGRWVRGDLHHHTHHSDGAYTVAEVVHMAEAAGLDFLALTDHNTISQNRYLGVETPVLLIPGLEITTNHGHANVIGLSQWVDFRWRSPRALDLPLQEIHAQGGLVVLNHPECDWCPWEWGRDFAYDLVEVWNGPWTPRNRRAVAWWDQQLRAGRRIPAAGGSDMHRIVEQIPLRTGTAATHVWVEELTLQQVLAGLKAGRSSISRDPGGPVVYLTPAAPGTGLVQVAGGAGARLRLCSDGEERELTVSDDHWEQEVPVTGSYLRAELRDDDDRMLSLSNPVYRE